MIKKHLKGKERRKIRSKYYNIKPSVWIGKNGITNGLINEIKNQLKNKKIIKVKFQKSILENERKKDQIKKLLENIIKQIDFKVEIIDIRGRTAILMKL